LRLLLTFRRLEVMTTSLVSPCDTVMGAMGVTKSSAGGSAGTT
jgi:hypothetical protein